MAALVDPAIRLLSGRMAADAAGGCAQLRGVNIDYGRWPNADRALTGQLNALSITIDRVAIGALTASSVRLTGGDVTYSPWSLIEGTPSIDVHNGEVTAVVAESTFTTVLNNKGIPGQLIWGVGTSGAHVELLGVSIPVSIRASHGDIAVSLVSSLFPLRLVVHVPGIAIERISPGPQGLEVGAVVSGQPARLACTLKSMAS